MEKGAPLLKVRTEEDHKHSDSVRPLDSVAFKPERPSKFALFFNEKEKAKVTVKCSLSICFN